MDFGDVVLENRPIVICQCKYELCMTCSTRRDVHGNLGYCTCAHTPEQHGNTEENNPFDTSCQLCGSGLCEKYLPQTDHDFYQRSKTWGPRVVINQQTKTGKCNDCGREYEVNVTAHMTPTEYADHVGVH